MSKVDYPKKALKRKAGNKHVLWIISALLFLCICFILGKQDDISMRVNHYPINIKENQVGRRMKGSDIFIVIPSGPEERHFEQRQAIRETWKLDLTRQMNVTFYVGLKDVPLEMKAKLVSESVKYKDLVLLETLSESYTGLTAKMVEIHRHVVKRYYGIKWVFKTDTDSWINIKLLVKHLEIPNVKTMLGRASALHSPVQEGEQKEYNNVSYPRFNVGAGYAVSYDIIEWVVEQFNRDWFKIFTNEDAALGIWVSATATNIIHTDRVNSSWDNKFWVENEMLKDCEMDHFVLHYLPAEFVKRAHRNYKSCENPCGCK